MNKCCFFVALSLNFFCWAGQSIGQISPQVEDTLAVLDFFCPNFQTQGFDDSITSLLVEDLNGDFFPDVVVGTSGQNHLLLGNGSESFFPVPHSFITNFRNEAISGDLDGDGDKDLILETQFGFEVHDNGGFANFVLDSAYIIGGGGQGIVLLFLDGDSFLDLLICFGDSALSLLNDGFGAFSISSIVSFSINSSSTWPLDWDTNGLEDLIYVKDDSLKLLVNNGLAGFGLDSVLYVGSDIKHGESGLLFGNPASDLVVLDGNLMVSFANFGPGSFLPDTLFTISSFCNFFKSGDLFSDSLVDFVFYSGDTSEIYSNSGDSVWIEIGYPFPSVQDSFFQMANFISGGNIEGLFANENELFWWFGDDCVPSCERTPSLKFCLPGFSTLDYSWEVLGGILVGDSNNSCVRVNWDSVPQGGLSNTINGLSEPMDTMLSFQVSVLSNPSFSIEGPKLVMGDSCGFSYSVLSPDSLSLVIWDLENGNILSGQGNDSIIACWDTSNLGLIQAVHINSNGCRDTVLDSIVIFDCPLPGLTINGSPFSDGMAFCPEDTLILGADKPGVGNILWSSSYGIIHGDSTLDSVSFSLSETGGTVHIQFTDSSSQCVSENQFFIQTQVPNLVNFMGFSQVWTDSCNYLYSVVSSGGSSFYWSVMGGSLETSPSNDSVRVCWDSVGLGYLAVSFNNNYGCDQKDTFWVDVSANCPHAQIASNFSDDILCLNTEYTLSVSDSVGFNFSWQLLGGTIVGSDNEENFTFVPTFSDTIRISLNILNPQTFCDTQLVLEYPVSNFSALNIPHGDTICSPDSILLGLSLAPHWQADWTIDFFSVLDSSPSGDSIFIVPDSLGPIWIGLTISDTLSNCEVHDSLDFFILPQQKLVDFAIDQVCAGSVSELSWELFYPGEVFWSVFNGQVISQSDSSVSLQLPMDTSLTLEGILVDSSGYCQRQWDSTIVLSLLDYPLITGPDTLCSLDLSQFSLSDPSWIGDWSTDWGNLLGASIGVNWINYSPISGGLDNIYVSLIDSSTSCLFTDSLGIEVLSTPDPQIFGPQDVCPVGCDWLFSFQEEEGVGYEWTVVGGSISFYPSSNEAEFCFPVPGPATLSLSASNSTFCLNQTEKPVNVLPIPNLQISGGGANVFLGDTVWYTISSSSAYSYDWVVSGGEIISPQGEQSIAVVWDSIGPMELCISADLNGHCFQTNCITSDVILAIERSPDQLGVSLFPNPFNSTLNLFLKEGFCLQKVRVFDTLGREHYSESLGPDCGRITRSFMLEFLPRGIYFVELSGVEGQVIIKVLKE